MQPVVEPEPPDQDIGTTSPDQAMFMPEPVQVSVFVDVLVDVVETDDAEGDGDETATASFSAGATSGTDVAVVTTTTVVSTTTLFRASIKESCARTAEEVAMTRRTVMSDFILAVNS